MKTLKLFVCGIFIVSMSSCAAVTDKIASEYMKDYEIDDMYETFDMTIFNDFYDKCTVEELKRQHGEPDRILDSEDYADFKILVYRFKGYSIDCYVKKNGNVVEFIYYSPNDIFPADKFFRNKKALEINTNDNKPISYYADMNKNMLRLLRPSAEYNKKNINGFSCIALNDVSELVRSDIDYDLQYVNKNGPFFVGTFDILKSIEKNGKSLLFEMEFLEEENYSVHDIVEKNHKYIPALAIRMFNQNGPCSLLAKKMLRGEYSAEFKFVGSRTKAIVRKNIDFGKMFAESPTNAEVLNAEITYDNSNLFIDNSEDFTYKDIIISDGYITLPFEVRNDSDVVVADSTKVQEIQKREIRKSFYDDDNPTKKYLQLAYRNELGIRYIWNYIDKGVTIRACYPWDEVKSILFRKEN